MKEIKSIDILENLKKTGFISEKSKFFNKGKIGNWRNYFSEDLSKRFDEMLATKLKSKIDFDFGSD
jgi:hypothetical protein